jgi:hypothetical protein
VPRGSAQAVYHTTAHERLLEALNDQVALDHQYVLYAAQRSTSQREAGSAMGKVGRTFLPQHVLVSRRRWGVHLRAAVLCEPYSMLRTHSGCDVPSLLAAQSRFAFGVGLHTEYLQSCRPLLAASKYKLPVWRPFAASLLRPASSG